VLAVNTTVIAVVAPPDAAPLEAVHGANIRVVQPAADAPALERAVAAWREAKRTGRPYLMHDADPLAPVADAWARLFESRGPVGELEVAVAETLARWRARSLDLPDYYLVVDPEALGPTLRHWFLGVLRAAAPTRVVTGRPTGSPGDALADLRPGPWWPELDRLLVDVHQRVPDQAGTLAVGPEGPGLLESSPRIV